MKLNVRTQRTPLLSLLEYYEAGTCSYYTGII